MAAPDSGSSRERQVDEPPPVGRSWRNVYAFVIGALAVTIGVLFALTRAFS